MSDPIDTLYASLAAEPGSWPCRLALIEALLIERRPDEAVSLLHGIAELPDDIDDRVIAARAFGLIDPADGLPVLEQILNDLPDHAAAHFEKAFLSHRAGDIETAKTHYFRAVALDPIHKDAKFEGKLLAGGPPGGAAPADPRTEVEKAFDEGQDISFGLGGRNETDAEAGDPAAKEEEEEKLFFPEPGEIPVITLSQAMAMEAERNPRAWRRPFKTAALNFAREAHPRPLAFTPRREYLRQFRKLRIQPRADRAPVDYDFRQPDDSLFSAALPPDRILVGAPVTEDGIPVASLQVSLRRRRRIRDSKIVKMIRRNKVQSFIVGLLAILALAAPMTLVTLGVLRAPPPQILARTAAPVEEIREIPEIVRERTPVRPASQAAAALSSRFLRSAAASAVSVPTFDGPGEGLGLSDLGAHFGAGMDFGSSGTVFFGTQVRGKIAVVFDVTGSMYDSIPVVIQEIEDHFRSAHVVAVHGSLFTDEGPDKLTPYASNQNLLDMVDGFSGFGASSNDLDRALRRLRRCDSLEMTPDAGYLQSLGRAIELLMKANSAQTIFVFSDFQDGEDKGYLREMAELARRSRVKIVFHHPTSFLERTTRRAYEEFAKEANGEVKEGGLGRRR